MRTTPRTLDAKALERFVEERYLRRTPTSRAHWQKSTGLLPLGVGGAAKYYDPYPVYLDRAEGGHVWDLDGNRYVDFLMGAGPNLLGHRHPSVMEAARRQLDRITQSLAPTILESELAERLRSHMPYLERIRFANTGSEAVRTCLRAARAYTGRTRVAKVEGAFHGSDDPFLISTVSFAGPPDRPEQALESAGVPSYVADDVLVLPFDDIDGARSLIDEYASSLAAVVIEPIPFSTGGAIPTSVPYAQMLRELTTRRGIVLIFDEVVTCFRMGLAGAPGYLGVTPDLSAVGKAVGGGFPLAAMGGRADLMEAVLGSDSRPEKGRGIFQSGTFTGNPVSLAAGLAALDVLEREPVLEKIDALADRFRIGLRSVFEGARVPAQVTGVGSIFQLHFVDREPRSRRDIAGGNLELLQWFLLGMVAQGVLWPPVHPGVTTYTHEEADIERAIDAAAELASVLVGQVAS